MNTLPPLGARVRHTGRAGCGAYTGTVLAHYPTRDYDYDANDEPILPGRVRPVREWHVSVTVDELPTPWPYPGTNKIAPCVADLHLVKESAQ